MKTIYQKAGRGGLFLKKGGCGLVKWELEVNAQGEFGKGRLTGEAALLEAAAKDGCARMLLFHKLSIAIAIDRHRGCRASFTTLLRSWQPGFFIGREIEGIGPVGDGDQFLIEFVDETGMDLKVLVPTPVMRACAPALQRLTCEEFTEETPNTISA